MPQHPNSAVKCRCLYLETVYTVKNSYIIGLTFSPGPGIAKYKPVSQPLSSREPLCNSKKYKKGL